MDFEFWNVLVMLVMIVASFMFMYGIFSRSCVYGGEVWGIKIPMTEKQTAFKKKGLTLMIIGIIGMAAFIIPTFPSWFKLLFTAPPIALLYIPLWVGSMVMGAVICKKNALNPELIEKADNALVLGELPYIKAAESHISESKAFVVSFEGIAFVNNMNYCFAVERYEDYKMGELATPEEVGIVAGYFQQKYGELFSSKADFERIPGTPGQVVTFIGSDGVSFGYVKGTNMQAIYKSHIFLRK